MNTTECLLIIEFESSGEIARISLAVSLAAHCHANQRRKDELSTPYINHPIAVFSILAAEAEERDVDVLCAALCHDLIEDCASNDAERARLSKEIQSRLGQRVLAIVREVTDVKELPKVDRKRLQVEHAPFLSEGATLVKVADKIANLRDVLASPPKDWDVGRRLAYFDWANQVVCATRPINSRLRQLFDEVYSMRGSLAVDAIDCTERDEGTGFILV
jgi:GTP diphosphokinase / guanosine-3',5'-bis(diphosphate) 3'-diphosphatase